MIITKDFIHKLLTDEPEHVKQFANSLVGLDHLTALSNLSKHMSDLHERDLNKRNEYVILKK